MKLVIQQLQNKVEMSWIVANSQQFTSCKFSQYICRGKAEDIYFTQIGSFLTSSPNLSGLQMRRCEFIFSGKWDFDRKFTERLPATVGCLYSLQQHFYTKCAVYSAHTAQQFVRIMRLWPFTLGSPISNHSDQVRFPTFLFRTSRTNQNLKEEWNFWKSESLTKL